jgi:poly(3-hydroxybutyrate) depolymerase
MLYELHDLSRRALKPMAFWSRTSAKILRHTPLPGAKTAAAGWEFVHRLTKEYTRPTFDITEVELEGERLSITEEVVVATPFCQLVRFVRGTQSKATRARLDAQPKVLLCAPLSGHFATLLRDTVRAFAADHDVYITDWVDARQVPLTAGRFGLEDYVDHLMTFMRFLGPEQLHVVAVCQPTVPALAAVSLMASNGEITPKSLTLMGGPIDGRRSPTAVNRLAMEKPIHWFEDTLCYTVPAGHPGVGRRVYPGFLQLSAFVSMNPKGHAKAYRDYYFDRVRGRDEKADKHERFYDEYNAVLDMDADYYLETVRIIFQDFLLPRGLWPVRGQKVKPEDIQTTALLTVEGADDDITGKGQTHVTHELCTGVPEGMRQSITAPGCGHYGIFSGSKFRDAIYPQLRAFVAAHHTPKTMQILPAEAE